MHHSVRNTLDLRGGVPGAAHHSDDATARPHQPRDRLGRRGRAGTEVIAHVCHPGRRYQPQHGAGAAVIYAPALFGLLALVLWEAAVRLLDVPSYLLPGPIAIIG